MWKRTEFILANFILPMIVGLLTANMGAIGCNFWGHSLKNTPCWLLNFIIFAFLTAVILDLIIYYFIPIMNKGRIEIPPDIRPITDKKTKNKFIYGPAVKNIGSVDITDCFVDLERTYWVSLGEDGIWQRGSEVKFSGRLSWVEDGLQSKECKRTIERDNLGTPIRLVEVEHGKEMIVRLCDEKFTVTKGKFGELRFLIRVGGLANGVPIKPVFSMVIISQGPWVGGATTRRLKNREEFDKYNKLTDAIYQEENRKKIGKPSTRKENTHKPRNNFKA